MTLNLQLKVQPLVLLNLIIKLLITKIKIENTFLFKNIPGLVISSSIAFIVVVVNSNEHIVLATLVDNFIMRFLDPVYKDCYIILNIIDRCCDCFLKRETFTPGGLSCMCAIESTVFGSI